MLNWTAMRFSDYLVLLFRFFCNRFIGSLAPADEVATKSRVKLALVVLELVGVAVQLS